MSTELQTNLDAATADASAPVDLKNFNPSRMETAREMALALRNIMLAALRYDSSQASTMPASAIVIQHVKLESLDEAIVDGLEPKARSAYIKADKEMQGKLLFSNDCVGAHGEGARALGPLLMQQLAAVAGDEDATTRFAQKLAVLEALNCIQAPSTPIDETTRIEVASEGRPWIRYYAWRKVQYLNQLEQAWVLDDFVADERPLLEQLDGGSDLELLHFEQFGTKVLKGSLVAPESMLDLDASPASENFASAKQELININNNLKEAAANISKTNDRGQLADYERKYAELTQRQQACTYLLEQKRAQLSTGTRLKESALDFVNGNRANTKAVLLATGNALWAGAGVSLARAIKDHLDGKRVDVDAVRKQVLTGVAIAAGTALTTYLLGPVGPLVSGIALNYFFPKPDPVMEGIKSIESKVKEGFAKTDQRFDELQKQIDTRFEDVCKKLDQIGEYIVDKTSLELQLRAFKEKINKADDLLNEIDNEYNALFKKGKRTASDERVRNAHKDFRDALDSLVRQFYHPGYSLERREFDKRKSDQETIAQLMIDFYQQPIKEKFQPFHVTCQMIVALSDRLRLLVLRYDEMRRKLQDVHSAVALFFYASDKNGFLKSELLDLHRSEGDDRNNYFVDVMLIDRVVLGERNYALNQALQSYLQKPEANEEFNLLKGFALLNPADLGQQYVPDAAVHPSTWLRAESCRFTVLGFDGLVPARYYVSPLNPAQSTSERAYQLTNFWTNGEVPVRLTAHIALAKDDQLMIYDAAFKRALPARAAAIADPIFAQSIEQFFLNASELPLPMLQRDEFYELSLPTQGTRVGLRVTERSGSQTLETMRMDLGPKRILTNTAPVEAEPTSVRPLMKPDAVGFVQHWRAGRSQGEATYNLAAGGDYMGQAPRHGVWTAKQALGTFRPASKGTTDALRPFCHVLLTGEDLVSLRSPNGRHWLQFDHIEPGKLPVLYYYTDGKRGGAVLDHYDFSKTLGFTWAIMQADGNFVLYSCHRGRPERP